MGEGKIFCKKFSPPPSPLPFQKLPNEFWEFFENGLIPCSGYPPRQPAECGFRKKKSEEVFFALFLVLWHSPKANATAGAAPASRVSVLWSAETVSTNFPNDTGSVTNAFSSILTRFRKPKNWLRALRGRKSGIGTRLGGPHCGGLARPPRLFVLPLRATRPELSKKFMIFSNFLLTNQFRRNIIKFEQVFKCSKLDRLLQHRSKRRAN